jgi:hypothetical protein
MTTQLELRLSDANGSTEELEIAAIAIREDLLCLDSVVSASRLGGQPAPPGTRSASIEELGAILVVAKSAADLAGPVLSMVRKWAKQPGKQTEARTATMTIDGNTLSITGGSAENEDKLVDAWLQRIAQSEVPN